MKLTVSIPSNNKKSFLIETLKYFLDLKIKDNFELVVSDNSNITNHNFEKFIYENKDEIIYKKNNKKKMSANFDNAVNLASGDYVWIFGDDDIPSKESIKHIKSVINKKEFDIIIVNSNSFHSQNEIIEEIRLPLVNDLIFKNSKKDNDKFMEYLISYTTFISSIIINKKKWLDAKIEKPDEFFFHIQKLLKIKLSSKAYFISKPSLKMRVFSQTWTNHYFKIWMVNWPKVIWSSQGYSSNSMKKVINFNPLTSPKLLLSKRAYGYYNYMNFKKYIFHNKSIPNFKKIVPFLIILVPRFIYKNFFILLIKTKIKKKTISFSPELSLIQLRK